MLNSKWSEFWWTHIAGANLVVTNVASALSENKMVVLDVPDDLPWRYQLRTAIELTFRRNVSSESYVVQIIDDLDECYEEEPGRFLLERFAKSRNVRNGYRSASKKSLQDYIIENNLLRNSIIWVKGLDTKRAKEWVTFCREFNSESVENGLFVLEVKNTSDLGDIKAAEKICYSNSVSKYDVLLFDSLFLAEKRNYPDDNWKRYISALAAELCVTDAEISVELLACSDLRHREPLEGLSRIEETGEFSRRGADSKSNHILSYYRRNDIQEIQKRIWSTQLQILFPLIEMKRLEFIRAYYETIKNALHCESIKQFDEIISQPEGLELGTLDYLIRSHKISVPIPADRERISFLKDCRNRIAHMNCCSIDDVRQLIDG